MTLHIYMKNVAKIEKKERIELCFISRAVTLKQNYRIRIKKQNNYLLCANALRQYLLLASISISILFYTPSIHRRSANMNKSIHVKQMDFSHLNWGSKQSALLSFRSSSRITSLLLNFQVQ